jgi:murein DD-endopeptidase MepM/ murein hydrolase activator NlpD
MPTRHLALALLAIALTLGTGAAHAKHMYQYTDEKGVVHFTDVKPGDDVKDVKSTQVRTDREPLVRIREDGTDADRTMTFVNSAGGPVSVDVDFQSHRNVESEPALPARIVLAPHSEVGALRIIAPAPEGGFSYRLRYTFMPGDFRAQQDEGAQYRVPFASGESFGIAQAFGGKASHSDKQNYYAVDIVMPVGTPVLAAREGVVMTVDNDFFGAGLDMARYGDRANNIRIVHSDGTMAVYAHLELESAKVHVGDHVRAGQELALSGDTGYTNGPHLHFCVQVNSNMALISVPFEFTGANGSFVPEAGMLLSAP